MSNAYSPVRELNLLKELQDRSPGYYSGGFELRDFGYDPGLAEWLDLKDPHDLEFLDRLIPFAQASTSGSFFALWKCDDREDLATLPVIRFGDEGDLDVVAQGLRELFELLALDSESFDLEGPDEGYYDTEDGHTDGHSAYLEWLEENFGLAPPEDPDSMLDRAEQEYGARFRDWLRQFAPGDWT
ncbi:hypothetical protein [Actinomadura rudentiformis]|uniref:Uncharacterized protein n=1 Tax=Actinomadura rudentiformis TaxID=359158 RepID=A0A6H9YZD5_9ACTN|nr:hypothetical protein [Actinomadura rudentiformis]KAB2345923.1 hypothetical protein F8566_24690 [Actinomadura rudentiformis]